MRQVITIEKTPIPVISYNGCVVVSLMMIDQLHQRSSGTARRNFCDYRHRFIEGEDFYHISSVEIAQHQLESVFADDAAKNVLLTESGYLMLVKNFDDELTWRVQRQLVNQYFKVPVMTIYSDELPSHHAGVAQDIAVSSVLSDPTMLRKMLSAYADKVIALEEIIHSQEYKIQFYDDVAKSKNGQSIQEIAKVMGIGEQRLFEFLRNQKLLMPSNLPFQQYIDGGYFKVTLKSRASESGTVTYNQTLVTGKGFQLIKQRINYLENLVPNEVKLQQTSNSRLHNGARSSKVEDPFSISSALPTELLKPSISTEKSKIPSPLPAIIASMNEANKSRRRIV